MCFFISFGVDKKRETNDFSRLYIIVKKFFWRSVTKTNPFLGYVLYTFLYFHLYSDFDERGGGGCVNGVKSLKMYMRNRCKTHTCNYEPVGSKMGLEVRLYLEKLGIGIFYRFRLCSSFDLF